MRQGLRPAGAVVLAERGCGVRWDLERASGCSAKRSTRRTSTCSVTCSLRTSCGLLCNATAIVGNSSVAIRECSYLGVPAVNIGTRQLGRERGRNVIDVGTTAARLRRHRGARQAGEVRGTAVWRRQSGCAHCRLPVAGRADDREEADVLMRRRFQQTAGNALPRSTMTTRRSRSRR
jgi:hypothetical protein